MNVGALVTNVGFRVDEASMHRVVSSTGHMARQIGYLLGAGSAVAGIKNILVYTGQMEMLSAQFGVLVGDMQKGRQIMSDIRNMAATTPFETKELAGAVRLMMTFGAETKNVLGYASMLGDITMGDKIRFGQISLAFSQMLAANKLMGQDLLQMVQGGYNPLKTIAEMRKISYTEALKMMAKDQITPDMVVAAMQKDTQVGGKFYKGMLEGAKTLSGLWSTVSDNVKMVALSVGNMFEGGIKETMAGFINLLNDNMVAIQNFFVYLNLSLDRVGGSFQELGRVAGLVTKNLAPLFLGIAHVLSVAFEVVKTAFVGLLWALAPLIDAIITSLMEVFAIFDVYVSDSTNNLIAYGKILEGVRDMATMLGSAFKAVGPVFLVVTSIVSALVDVLGYLNTAVEYLVSTVEGLDVMIVPMTLLTATFLAMGSAIAVSLAPLLAFAAACFAVLTAQQRITEALILAGKMGTQQDIDRITSQRNLNALKREAKDLDERAKNGENVKNLIKNNKASTYVNSRIVAQNGGEPLGIASELSDAFSQFKGTGENQLDRIIKQIEAEYAKHKIDLTQHNTVNLGGVTVDQKGGTPLTPEGLQHSLDKAARSLFDIQLLGVRQMSR